MANNMINHHYSVLTTDVNPIAHNRSVVALNPSIKGIKANLISNEDQALVCLLTFYYSDFYKRYSEPSPLTYNPEDLVVNINATKYMNEKLNSSFSTNILNLATQADRDEFASIKSTLDKFAFLVYLLLRINDG